MEMKINSALIVELRSHKAWSQQHLADVSGLSLRTVQRVENTSCASPDSIKAIAMAFDKVPADLAVQNESEPSNPTSTQSSTHRFAHQRVRLIWAGLCVLMALVAGAYSYAHRSGDTTSAKAQDVTVSVDAVEQAAMAWLAIIDAEDYALSWEQLGVLAKASVTKSQWAEAIAQSKRLFGEVNARELRAIDTSTAMLGLPTGEYATLTFSSTMEKRPNATEVVTMTNENGTWAVVGYFIQ